MAINVGELQATLGINTKGFTSGIDTANKHLTQLTNNLETGVKGSAAEASSGMANAQQSAKKLGDEIQKAGDKSQTAAGEIKNAGTEIEKAGDEIEETGESSKTANKFLGLFKTGLAAIGVPLGIGALINKIKEIVTEFNNAYQASKTAQASFERVLGSSTGSVDSQKFESYVDALISGTTYSAQDIANVVARVKQYNKDASDFDVVAIAREYLALGELSGQIGGALMSNIDSAREAFAKWGVSTDDQVTELSNLMTICQETGIDMATLLSYMNSMDYMGEKLGYSFSEMASAIGNTGANISDLQTVSSRFETFYNQIYQSTKDELGSGASGAEIDDAIAQKWKDAIAKAGAMTTQEERNEFWANVFGEEVPSKLIIDFAKGISALYSEDGRVYTAGSTASEYVSSTRTSSERQTINDNIKNWEEAKLAFVDAAESAADKVNQNTIDNYEKFKIVSAANTETLQATIEASSGVTAGTYANGWGTGTLQMDMQEIQNTIDRGQNINIFIEGMSDPFTATTDSQAASVAVVNNPAISS